MDFSNEYILMCVEATDWAESTNYANEGDK
jgi:hypothetical protein